MSKSLEVSLKSKRSTTDATNEIWEATIKIPGVRPTKLIRKSSGTTQFASRSAVLSSARNLAKTLGFAGVVETTSTSTTK